MIIKLLKSEKYGGNTKVIKGCIFDLDGVIVDTAKYHYLAWKRLANNLGYDFTQEHNELFKGVSRMKCMDIMCELFNLTLSDDEKFVLSETKNSWYREYISQLDKNEILPGAEVFLQQLKINNIKIALGSASKNAMIILNQLDLTKYFDSIIDGTKVRNAKPNPEVFLLGVEELGLNPKNCVVFEDAVAGIEAAHSAGMKAVGVGESNNLNKCDLQIKCLYEMSIEKLFTL